jgi:transposase InsO family protein
MIYNTARSPVFDENSGSPSAPLTSDNEPIYASKEKQNTLWEFGIQWEPAEPYTPSQNAIAEL